MVPGRNDSSSSVFLSRLNPYPFRFALAKETSGYWAEHRSCSTKYKRIKTHFSFTSIDYGQSHQPRLELLRLHIHGNDGRLTGHLVLSEAAQSFCASGQHLYFLVSWLFEANDMHTTYLLFGCGRCGWGSDQWWVEQLDHGSIRWPVNLKLWGHGAKSEDLASSFATDDLKRPGNKMLEC